MDHKFWLEQKDFSPRIGSTACIVIIAGDRIICANCGDSRAILSKKGKVV